MKTKIYLDRENQYGDRRLRIQITIPGHKYFPIKTDMYVDPSKWVSSEQRHKTKAVNEKIKAIFTLFDNIEIEALKTQTPLTKEFVKSRWRKYKGYEVEQSGGNVFFDYFDKVRAQDSKTKSKNWTRIYKQVKDSILEFRPETKFQDLNTTFFEDYIEFLFSEKELLNSTVGKRIDIIKIVLKSAAKNGIEVPNDYEDLKKPTSNSTPVWLSWDEVGKIEKLKLRSRKERIVRDEFLLRCYTGLRTSDMDEVTKNNFFQKDDRWYLKLPTVKTKKDFILPLHPKAVSLFESYEFRIPKLSIQIKNRYIKRLAEQAGIDTEVQKIRYSGQKRITTVSKKWEIIATHTARRTFGRKFMEDNGNINILCELYGHSDTKTTKKYIGWEDEELSDSVINLKL